jgi:hypothetical protein
VEEVEQVELLVGLAKGITQTLEAQAVVVEILELVEAQVPLHFTMQTMRLALAHLDLVELAVQDK